MGIIIQTTSAVGFVGLINSIPIYPRDKLVFLVSRVTGYGFSTHTSANIVVTARTPILCCLLPLDFSTRLLPHRAPQRTHRSRPLWSAHQRRRRPAIDRSDVFRVCHHHLGSDLVGRIGRDHVLFLFGFTRVVCLVSRSQRRWASRGIANSGCMGDRIVSTASPPTSCSEGMNSLCVV